MTKDLIHYLRPVRNVGTLERVASGVVGAGMLALAIRDQRPLRYVAAAAGLGLLFRGVSGNCKAYQALGITTCSVPRHPKISVPGNRGVRVEEIVVVTRPVSEVYRAWRNLENLPNFMTHLESVEQIDSTRSLWKARGPAGLLLSWEAEVINEKPDEMIAWRSLEGADVDNAGTVRFRSENGGTEVRVTLEYDPAGGRIGAAVARLFQRDPAIEIREDLQRFKQILETAG